MQTIPREKKMFIPWRTAIIAALALGIAASPEMTSILTATRENWGQLWPVFTGHLCHWTGSHLFWDLIVFVIVGPLVEKSLGRAFLPWLGLASVGIVAAVFLLMPDVRSYRGLSGIDTFLYTFAVLQIIRNAYPHIPYKMRGLSFLPLLLVVAKIGFELATGETLFTGSLGDGVVPLPIAHAVGALMGLIGWLVWSTNHEPPPTSFASSTGSTASETHSTRTARSPIEAGQKGRRVPLGKGERHHRDDFQFQKSDPTLS